MNQKIGEIKILYTKVSTLDQNTDRQKINEKDYQIVIEDKCSGVIPLSSCYDHYVD